MAAANRKTFQDICFFMVDNLVKKPEEVRNVVTILLMNYTFRPGDVQNLVVMNIVLSRVVRPRMFRRRG